MYGRLGGMYFLHLTEASEQRRRLVHSNQPELGCPAADVGVGHAADGVGVFFRLAAIIGVAFAAIAALAMWVE